MLQEKSLNGVKILSINKLKIEEKIKVALEKIKEDKNVYKIIIFGSFIRDDFKPFSDIDLIIVLKDSKEKFLKRGDHFIDYFREIPLDVNLIVYTKKEYEKMLKDKNKFILEANKGKLLYENPNP